MSSESMLSDTTKKIDEAILILHLLKGLSIFHGGKAKDEGIPKAIQLAYWLKKQTIFLIRKANEVGRPKVIEAGQISKGLVFLPREI